ncbi:N-acetylmuramoyl-L-alanine amidase [Desulfosporosinus hippei DSM 8344]|uniref:N-acetylmuramoyl-L-alanine amidase n=2 Tax=Desulfosporosinus TaxID=79206 RepID=A0A1G8HGC9_9FIRM|nr:N-acetylmuramoyl-L-alanine amidase [Desulfosporosinus hippei DSM 8344]
MAIFLCGIMCLCLWQANIYPALGLGSKIVNIDNNGIYANSSTTMKIAVQRGETLWHLAERYQTSVDELVKFNRIKSPDQIREGQTLWVPNPIIQKKTEDLQPRDVKEYTKEVVAVSTTPVISDEKVKEVAEDTPWWVNILRSIPVLATVYKQESSVADSSQLSSEQPKSDIQTYEIIVSQGTKKVDKQVSPLPDPKDNSQIHSRGLGRLVSKEEVELLSRVIYGEARGEDFLGQVAVGAVVLNRLKDPRFPKTIKGIVYQSGAFTAVDDRQIHLDPDDQAYKAAEAALSGLDPTNGAIFYYNPQTATDKWIKSRTVIKRIGNHTFSI